jgi:hypothetical protein
MSVRSPPTTEYFLADCHRPARRQCPKGQMLQCCATHHEKGLCRPWGHSRRSRDVRVRSAHPPRAAIKRTSRDFAFVPCVDGSVLARAFFTFAAWSVQPCVRPLDAVHMTAGHNALRGSGPGQNPAFDNNAMAQVGCPDRRIDRLCITRCSLLQPSHHAGCPARSRFTPQARRVACNARP